MMEEIWKPIPDYEGLYEASNMGRIRSLPHITVSSNGKRVQVKGQIMKPCLQHSGYYHVVLRKNGKKTTLLVHRLILISFVGFKPGYDTNHKDENKSNNRLDNLEWVTRKCNCNYGTRNMRVSESKKGKDTAKCCDRIGDKNPNSIQVIALNKDMTIHNVYSCFREAGDALGVNESTIARRAKHLFETNEYKGYLWYVRNNLPSNISNIII